VLGFVAVPITGGRLGDISGRKRLFVIGVAGFTLASLWCGVAGSPEMLIVALFFEGAMAGPRMPQIPVVREWPQMREVVRGPAAHRSCRGGLRGAHSGSRGAPPVSATSGWSSGATTTAGAIYRNVTIAELNDGEAVRVTDYSGTPFDTPE
jgi:MFS family permease